MCDSLPDPSSVDLTDVSDDTMRNIICCLQLGGSDYNGEDFGARISAIFVVMIVSSAVTFFPVLATRSRLNIPLYVYLFARYFGAGVIIATAFVHLLDPAYSEIGPDTCVGMTGGWATYSWVPALALASCMSVFLMDFVAERYVEKKYGLTHGPQANQNRNESVDAGMLKYALSDRRSTQTGHQHLHSGEQDQTIAPGQSSPVNSRPEDAKGTTEEISVFSEKESVAERSFQTQIAAFLILEFGVIFHSVIIGLTLGTAGDEFATLYPVIVFHQSFEGMGIGARLSAIQFPKRFSWMPWALCTAYGLTTPISIAIGIGLRYSYAPESFTALVVSGVLDSISAGILLYTGLVELLARDFLFNPDRTDDDKQLAFMMGCTFLGAGIMALLGKWA